MLNNELELTLHILVYPLNIIIPMLIIYMASYI